MSNQSRCVFMCRSSFLNMYIHVRVHDWVCVWTHTRIYNHAYLHPSVHASVHASVIVCLCEYWIKRHTHAEICIHMKW
jgi:hypothetical protein